MKKKMTYSTRIKCIEVWLNSFSNDTFGMFLEAQNKNLVQFINHVMYTWGNLKQ
jgi:hypothetical protein